MGGVHQQNFYSVLGSYFQIHTFKPGELRDVAPGEGNSIIISLQLHLPAPLGVTELQKKAKGLKALGYLKQQE